MSASNLDSIIQRNAETMAAEIDGGLSVMAFPTKLHPHYPARFTA
tara:strand:+ start:245 stop:379 length:135 start_codon:yes stop_codon:yes gene_type:complete